MRVSNHRGSQVRLITDAQVRESKHRGGQVRLVCGVQVRVSNQFGDQVRFITTSNSFRDWFGLVRG